MYGIVLREKELTCGLSQNDVIDLFGMLNDIEAYPIELEAKEHECSAMGFISQGQRNCWIMIMRHPDCMILLPASWMIWKRNQEPVCMYLRESGYG